MKLGIENLMMGYPVFFNAALNSSDFSMEMVPTNTGCPVACLVTISLNDQH
jgi:hypothetical protein